MNQFARLAELKAKIPKILDSPKDEGAIKMMTIRPESNQRKIVQELELNRKLGCVGDIWSSKPSSSTPDGSPHPEKQLTIMNSRCVQAIAGSKDRWSLAGDQVYADLDLSLDNIPPGTQLQMGSAIVEVSAHPHTGCKKFVERFGVDALRFVSSPAGKQNNFRGINAFVVKEGTITSSDTIKKVNAN